MKKSFHKSSNRWVVKEKSKMLFSYSVGRYGEYAEKLADLSIKTGRRHYNYFEKHEEYSILKIYSKTYGYIDCKVDTEDIKRLDICSWTPQLNKTNNKIYLRNSGKYGFIHRFIMNINNETYDFNKLIDHINRDTLDNRKENLRITDTRTNNINRDLQKNNKTGVMGVSYNDKIKSWVSRITNPDGKRETRTFSVNKYGNEKAKELAINWRSNKEIEYGY